jgi:hypothetical protein
VQDVRKRWARRRSKSLAAKKENELSSVGVPPEASHLGWMRRRLRGK